MVGVETDARIAFCVLFGVLLAPFVKFYGRRGLTHLFQPAVDTAEGGNDARGGGGGDGGQCRKVGENSGSDEEGERGEALTRLFARLQAVFSNTKMEDTAFFQQWLGPHILFSCCAFRGIDADDLVAAEVMRMRAIAAALQLERGMSVLLVGCEWGGLACYLARHHGVHVTGVSADTDRVAAARRWAVDENQRARTVFLHGSIDDIEERFDRIVHVTLFGIFNEIPHEHLLERLNDGGVALIHRFRAASAPGEDYKCFDAKSNRGQTETCYAASGSENDDDDRGPEDASAIEDLSDDFLLTLRCWNGSLSVCARRLQAYEGAASEWMVTVGQLIAAFDNGEVALEQVLLRPLIGDGAVVDFP